MPVPEIAETLAKHDREDSLPPPSVPLVLFVLLMPIGLIFLATTADMLGLPGQSTLKFLGDPATALTLSFFLAAGFFGLGRGLNRSQITKMATESLAPIASLLLITGAGGSFKQVITVSRPGSRA